jgi:hypothetical protein
VPCATYNFLHYSIFYLFGPQWRALIGVLEDFGIDRRSIRN